MLNFLYNSVDNFLRRAIIVVKGEKMTKSLYSMILSDEVIKRIDSLAADNNTNRSNLINQILAEYVSYTTPEKRINKIFAIMNDLVSVGFNPLNEQADRLFSLKTNLDYKYKPSVKYTVELYRTYNATIGELKVTYRSQSPELVQKLNDFFRLIIEIERRYLSGATQYTIDDTKFVRTFVVPNGNHYSENEIAVAINEYIKHFDYTMKSYLSDKFSTFYSLQTTYENFLSDSILI